MSDYNPLAAEELIGYAGGVVLAVALVPQLVKSIQTRSMEDLSYSWQIIYIVGLWVNFVYFVMVGAVAAWVTLLFEMFVAHVLFGWKFWLEKVSSPSVTPSITEGIPDAVCEPAQSEKYNQMMTCTSTAKSVAIGASLSNATVCSAWRFSRGYKSGFKKEGGNEGLRVRDVFRGFHFVVDVTFTQAIPPEFGHKMMEVMLSSAKEHDVNALCHQIEIFDGKTSPPGFASAVLIDESHMSAHCYSDQGMLAFDCFTCGSNPEGTRLVTHDVVDFLRKELGPDARILMGHMPRFPVSELSKMKEAGEDSHSAQVESTDDQTNEV